MFDQLFGPSFLFGLGFGFKVLGFGLGFGA